MISNQKGLAMKIKVGSFQISSSKVIVTDPCYSIGIWCQGIIPSVKNGTWLASVLQTKIEGWGDRNTSLIVTHQDYPDADPARLAEFEVGVDSGQAGIFDLKSYPDDDNHGKYNDESSFYGNACSITLNTANSAGTLYDTGVVSRSGFGDGGYNCYTASNDAGEVVAIRIVFIPEYDEE